MIASAAAFGVLPVAVADRKTTFVFDEGGKPAFVEPTTVRFRRQFAIVADGNAVAAPSVGEPITGGRGEISGAFAPQTANELALLLRSGALPARLVLLGEGASVCVP